MSRPDTGTASEWSGRGSRKSWTSAEDIPPEVAALCELFLGEGLRRRYDGEWVTLDAALIGETGEAVPPGKGVAYKSGAIDVVSSLISQAFRTSTGTWWSASFEATGQLAPGPRNRT